MISTNFPDIEQGVLVYRVMIGSPAYNAGVRAGDVITAIDGAAVTSSADVYKAVNAGKPLQVTIVRTDSPAPLSVSVTPETVQ